MAFGYKIDLSFGSKEFWAQRFDQRDYLICDKFILKELLFNELYQWGNNDLKFGSKDPKFFNMFNGSFNVDSKYNC